MLQAEIHLCQCAHCQQKTGHPDQELHWQMNLLLTRLDEQQRYWYVAVESNRMGLVQIACSPKSPGWTKRRSSVGAKNWRTPSVSDPASECVPPEGVDPRQKKRFGARVNPKAVD